MGRAWSILFLLVPVLGVAIFLFPAVGWWPLRGIWLPEDVSSYGYVIDDLFYFILYLTGVIFIATGLALFWYMWRYDGSRNPDPVKYTHGNHALEVCWSILPAAVLLFIAFYQFNSWADTKLRRPMNPGPDGVLNTIDDPVLPGPDGISGNNDDTPMPLAPLAEVTGRQFEWRLRYPGEDQRMGTADDLFLVNDLHVPLGENVVLAIKSDDVLHSFFLPNFRLKQDVVPGMKQYVWFEPTRVGTYDIVCAELCGWGHYKMKGRVTVETREKFDAWLQRMYEEQELSRFIVSDEEDE